MERYPVVIIGGGPAGLTAGYELMKAKVQSIVLEKSDKVGGISRTETYKGYRFDIGGHRFFTKVGEVEAVWKEILVDDFIQTPRLS
ncbi:MAG: NAD(P)-binding protein, partial [Leptolyngbyaceae bacterium]|nr:NAD(P)-binding protein [Leptolyngbyaceae bacterium]